MSTNLSTGRSRQGRARYAQSCDSNRGLCSRRIWTQRSTLSANKGRWNLLRKCSRLLWHAAGRPVRSTISDMCPESRVELDSGCPFEVESSRIGCRDLMAHCFPYAVKIRPPGTSSASDIRPRFDRTQGSRHRSDHNDIPTFARRLTLELVTRLADHLHRRFKVCTCVAAASA